MGAARQMFSEALHPRGPRGRWIDKTSGATHFVGGRHGRVKRVPKGTPGATKGFVSKIDNGQFRGLEEVWWGQVPRPVRGVAWQKMRRARGA